MRRQVEQGEGDGRWELGDKKEGNSSSIFAQLGFWVLRARQEIGSNDIAGKKGR